MKKFNSVFVRVLAALLIIGVVPVSVSSLLIISTYQRFAEQITGQSATEIEYLDILYSQNQILVTAVICISLIITLFFAVYLSRIFTLPLSRMMQAAHMLARGDLKVRLQTQRNDEFGQLAEGFNVMAHELDRAQQELKEANAKLEKRVLERTAELAMANAELRKTAEKIYDSGRMKSEFLANVSHELRTPLNAIQGYAELLVDGIYGEMTEDQKDALAKIRRNSQMLLKLINDVLDLARIESGRMPVVVERFDPCELVELTTSDVRPLFDKKGLDLIIVHPETLPQMESDPDKIRQIILNLLSNALKFTEQGRVEIAIGTVDAGQTTIFSVTDTGIGLSEKDLDIIFDQFRQADGSTARSFGGTGLGLNLSRKLANALDGEISVTSEKDAGTTFIVKLPTVFGDYDNVAGPLKIGTQGKPVVVAIDDDEHVLQIISDSLEPEGFSVIQCIDGNEGLKAIKETLPYAITLDIMMPYRDGWSVLREIMSNPRTKDIPVVIVSIIDDRARGFELGAREYLVKPINHRKLVETIRSFDQDFERV
jgi:signal transduction histidine kinase